MKSKQCGCDFCNDLRNIQPAKYIGGEDEEFEKWIEKAREAKQFILVMDDGFYIIDKCPVCKYVFTEDDYDSYKGL